MWALLALSFLAFSTEEFRGARHFEPFAKIDICHWNWKRLLSRDGPCTPKDLCVATLHKWRKCRLRKPPPDQAMHELVAQPQTASQPREDIWTVANSSTPSAEPHADLLSVDADVRPMPARADLLSDDADVRPMAGDVRLPLWLIVGAAAVGLVACWRCVVRSGFDGLAPTWHRELHEEERCARERQSARAIDPDGMVGLHHDLHMRPFQQTSVGRSEAQMSLEQRAAQKAAQIAAQERSRASQGAVAARRLGGMEAGIERVERQHERSRAHRRRAWRRTQGGVQEEEEASEEAGSSLASGANGPAATATSWVDAYEQELALM